jgi:copper(I)-binding protein
LSRRVAILVSVLLGVAVSVAACGGGAAGGGTVTISGAWVRPAPADGETAAYFTVTNATGKADVLVGVSTPDAQTAGLHQTSTDASGMTGMAPVTSIAVPAGGSVELKAGGYHVMLTGVARDLVVGGSIQLILTFEQAGVVRTTAEIRGG